MMREDPLFLADVCSIKENMVAVVHSKARDHQGWLLMQQLLCGDGNRDGDRDGDRGMQHVGPWVVDSDIRWASTPIGAALM